MSIQSEIDRISGNVSDALDAIAEKGVYVPAGANSDDLRSLIRAIPSGGRISYFKELLWTNSDPSSNFTAKTVSLDLSDYDAVVILYHATTSGSNSYLTSAVIGETASMDAWTSIGTSGQAILHRHRLADVTATGVTFGTCEQKRVNVTTASTNDNSGCIPMYIYGEIIPALAYTEPVVLSVGDSTMEIPDGEVDI